MYGDHRVKGSWYESARRWRLRRIARRVVSVLVVAGVSVAAVAGAGAEWWSAIP